MVLILLPCTVMQVLEKVDVAPGFQPHNSQLAHVGYLVPSLSSALADLRSMELAEPTLADLLALSSTAAPPGFEVAVRYAASQAWLWQLPPATLQLVAAPGDVLETTGCSVIAAGQRSLVLRLAGEPDFVIKIGRQDSIGREVDLHGRADQAQTRHIRRLHHGGSTGPLVGKVCGAGSGLAFLALQGFFPSNLKLEHASTAEKFSKVAAQVLGCPTAAHAPSLYHDLRISPAGAQQKA
jgi:hypothetical protein